MKAGSLLDDELGALRESVSSPSSGEVCLEVCLAPHAGCPRGEPRLGATFLSAFICFVAH